MLLYLLPVGSLAVVGQQASIPGSDSFLPAKTMPAFRRCFLFCALFLLACTGYASTWQICHLKVRIDRYHLQDQTVEARILELASKPGVECPRVGDTLVFAPETADYQNMLPRKAWPAKGTVTKMRYQYLDGWCKNDGNTEPCRIKHYPMGTAPTAGAGRH